MEQELAELVQPVVAFGLRLKERLRRGESLILETEQAVLKGLLLSDVEARRLVDFGGERLHHVDRSGDAPASQGSGAGNSFFGVRYALVCWLDEMFILDSSWESKWNERKLEVALYGSNDRAWKFWDQAIQAESRPGSDALEVFFLCVMLGFRGQLAERPDRLKSWTASTKSRILGSLRTSWDFPPELDPPIHVPPLHGAEKFQTMVIRSACVLLLMLAAFFFVVFKRLGT